MNVSMVSDHIPRMKKFDGSYRAEYETALKYASATTLNGKISLVQIQMTLRFYQLSTGAADTVCVIP